MTLSLHPSHYQQLPEAMLSPGGISLHPVIFNKGVCLCVCVLVCVCVPVCVCVCVYYMLVHMCVCVCVCVC